MRHHGRHSARPCGKCPVRNYLHHQRASLLRRSALSGDRAYRCLPIATAFHPTVPRHPGAYTSDWSFNGRDFAAIILHYVILLFLAQRPHSLSHARYQSAYVLHRTTPYRTLYAMYLYLIVEPYLARSLFFLRAANTTNQNVNFAPEQFIQWITQERLYSEQADCN